MHRLVLPLRFSLVVLALGLLVGCAPSISPLYRDFAPPPPLSAPPTQTDAPADPSGSSADSTSEEWPADTLLARAERALRNANWEPKPSPYAETGLVTEARTVGNIGVYRTDVTLEVVPFSGGFVRVLVHPYRRYLTGGRSKLPYLSPSLRSAILRELERAFDAEGLPMLGTARKRDEADT